MNRPPRNPFLSTTRLLLVLAAWMTVAAVQVLLVGAVNRSASMLLSGLIFYAPHALAWAAITPAIAWYALVIRRHSPSLGLTLASHLVALFATGIVDTVLRRALVVWTGSTPAVPFGGTLLYFADRTLVSYLIVLVVANALEVHDALIAESRRTIALKSKLTRAQLAALDEQLHPHFLFNSLGLIAELAHEAPSAASRMLRHLRSVLRFALERRGEEVSLRDELRALSDYVELQRARFTDWLTIVSTIDPAALDARVPPLLLQPLVENAIRHGLSRRTSKGRIHIVAEMIGDRVRLRVRDNGVGLQAGSVAPGHGIGLANVRDRLGTLYGGDASLRLYPDADGGAVAELVIPVRPSPEVRDQEDREVEGPDSPRLARVAFAFARRHRALAVGITWAAWGALSTQQSIAYLALRGQLGAEGLSRIARADFTAAMLWTLLTPAIVLAARWVPLERERIVARLAFHLVTAIVIAVSQALALQVLLGRPDVVPPWIAASVVWGMLVYGLVVAGAHQHQLREWLAERHLATERLRLNIAEAELRSAEARARPEELLEDLEWLATRVTTDPTEAERGITRLGDRLRAALASAVSA